MGGSSQRSQRIIVTGIRWVYRDDGVVLIFPPDIGRLRLTKLLKNARIYLVQPNDIADIAPYAIGGINILDSVRMPGYALRHEH